MDAQVATKTHDCKFAGCTNAASSPVGRYSYCADHQGQAKPKVVRPAASASTGTGTFAERIAELGSLAKKVDRARAAAKAKTEKALAAKGHADELERQLAAAVREVADVGEARAA